MSYTVNYHGSDGTIIRTDTLNDKEIGLVIEPSELMRLIDNSYIRVSTDLKTTIELGFRSMTIKANW
jgi:hypothetical protein